MQTERIKMSLIDLNEGQIECLPANPRSWTIRELEKLKNSIVETPELIELRPPIVVRHEGRYVALGGNMRICALKALQYETVNCIVVPDDLDAYKLKEIVIKDNSQLGAWDFDTLANEWSDYNLSDYGIPVFELGEFEKPTDKLAEGEGNAKPVDDRIVIKIDFSSEEFDYVNKKLRELGDSPEDAVRKIFAI